MGMLALHNFTASKASVAASSTVLRPATQVMPMIYFSYIFERLMAEIMPMMSSIPP